MIDAISYIIALVVCMTIDIIVHHWSIVFRKLREYQGAAEHANIIVRTYYAKKKCQIQSSCDATASRMIVHPPTC
jgi:hypothetical protein